jgi:hypothetical protein
MRSIFEADKSILSLMQCRNNMRRIALSLICQGYRVTEVDAESKLQPLLTLFDRIGAEKQPYLAYACSLLNNSPDPDLIFAKISEVADRSSRCESAVRQGFNIMISCSYQLAETAERNRAIDAGTSFASKPLTSIAGAMQRLQDCFEDYLDDHKEKAFNSAIVQPARMYYDYVGDASGRDHVNIHGMNWYLALLHATLGVQLPILPKYRLNGMCILLLYILLPHLMLQYTILKYHHSDRDKIGVIPFWDGLTTEAWEMFKDPANFGKDFEGIPKAQRVKSAMLCKHVGDDLFAGTPRLVGNDALTTGASQSHRRKRFATYANHYAYFLSRNFFIKKAFETLNGETKPEHAGFRKACDTMFGVFKVQWGIEADSLVEYAYTDDTYMELDIDNVGRFFAWIGVLKKTESDEMFLSRPLHRYNTTAPSELNSELSDSIGSAVETATTDLLPPLPPDAKRSASGFSLGPRRVSGGMQTLIAIAEGAREDTEDDAFSLARIASLQVCPLCLEPQLLPGDVVCKGCALVSRSYNICPCCGIVKEYNTVRGFFETDYDINEPAEPCVDCERALAGSIPDTEETKSAVVADAISDMDKKPSGAVVAIPDNECPICLDIKTDIQPLPHWEASGDVSEHKMCGDCLKALPNNECPFCKEIISKENFLEFITGFVDMYTSTAGSDANVRLLVVNTYIWIIL